MFKIFNFNFKNLIQGIANYRYIVISIREAMYLSYKNVLLRQEQKGFTKVLKSILNCPAYIIKENYIFVGYTHLEVFPYNGIFIQNTHRLFDIYPRVILVDSSEYNLKNTELVFDGTMCSIEKIQLDIRTSPLLLDTKLDSISLNFALDKLGTDSIDIFLKNIRSMLKPGGLVFGVTILNDTKHSKKALDYIQQQNKNGVWNNLKTSSSDLEKTFVKYFDDVLVGNVGSCTIFRLTLKKLKPTLQDVGLDYANVGKKYIEIK